MLAGIRTFISNYTNGMYFPHIQIIDIIEILIITVIVYEIMLWIKNTKAWMLLRGILMLGAFILVAWILIRTGKMNGSQMRRWKESYVRVMRWEVSVRVL